MSAIGKEQPKRPFYNESEKENPQKGPDKDHINDEPASDDLMTTGDRPLKDDDTLDRDVADEPKH